MPRSGKTPGARCQGASTAEIVEAIEGDIIVGNLMPRERLIEEELMSRFGVSRHIIRQALTELEHMNIVEHIPNRGALVRSYSVEEVLDLFELRDILESQCIPLMRLPATAAEVDTLNRILDRQEAAMAADDLVTGYRQNMAFHRALFALSGNKFLTEAIMDTASRTHGVRHQWLTQPEYLDRSRGHHRAMVAAIVAGDGAALLQLFRDHIAPSRDLYIRLAAKRPG